MKNELRLPETKRLLSGLGGILIVLSMMAPVAARAAVYYVAPTGNDGDPGTLAQPFASMQKGHDRAVAGDTLYFRGGLYKFVGRGATSTAGYNITKSGHSDSRRINYFAYQNEKPVFDFAQLSLSASETGAGIRVSGAWLHFKGLEICNVPTPGTPSNNGIWANGGSNNIYEMMNFHHNKGPGLSLANGTGGNLILNCDSHDNYDPNDKGENADGFGIHYQQSGPPTILRGCRAWHNSDDGYDMFKQEMPVIVENCWAMYNGYINNGTANGANGAGIKMGNSFEGVRHTIRNCVAWKNKNQGFYANHSYGGHDYYNNTAYENRGAAFDLLSDITLSGSKIHKLRNNIAFPANIKNAGASDMQYNTWNLGITVTANDFLSVSDSGWMGPRQPDGSLPNLPFMKLRVGSALVDKGIRMDLPITGTAPDLGAYEFGSTPTAIRARQVLPGRTAVRYGEERLRLFDPAGRRLDRNGARLAFRPVMARTSQADEHR